MSDLANQNKITILNIASTLIIQGLAFFSGPIFSSMLGTDNYGIASVYLTWVQLASTVFTLQAANTVAIARVDFPAEKQKEYQSSVLSLASLLYLGFAVLTIIVVSIASIWYPVSIIMVVCGLLHGWGWYCVTFMNSKFIYEFKAGRNFILSVITSFLTIGLSIWLIAVFPADKNYWGRIIGQSAVYTLIGIVLFVIVIASGKKAFSREYWKFTLPIAIPTVFHLLAHIVLNQSDRLMIQGIINNSAAGIYALACTFGAVLSTVWNALNNSTVPYFYEYMKKGQRSEIDRLTGNYTELFTVITMGFILLSRDVFHIYAERSFWEGTDLVPLFAVGYFFVFLYSFPVNFEFYNKKTKIIALGTTSAAICNVLLNLILINLIGILGAVIATAAAHFLQFLFHYIFAKRIDREGFPYRMKQFIPGFVAVMLTCAVYWFTRDLWMIRWALGIALGVYILVKMIRRRSVF